MALDYQQLPPNFQMQFGTVKQVLSGDTLVVRKNAVTTLPVPERTLVLTGVIAPKLARPKLPNNEVDFKDEPFAWESREYLRKLLLGKEVAFISDNKMQDREYARIWGGKDYNRKCVNTILLAEGYVKLRDGAKTPKNPHFKELIEIETKAKNEGRGLWDTKNQTQIRDVKWYIEDKKEFLKTHKEQMNAIVEYVRDCSTIRVLLLPSFHYITVMLSGVKCPSYNKDGPRDPLVEKIKFYLEKNLLQRDVTVRLELINNNIFTGTILLGGMNVGEILLSNGYATVAEWSVKSGLSLLRKAEEKARVARLGLWANEQVEHLSQNARDISGTIVEIVGGDSIIISTSSGSLQKATLASIRPPFRPAGAQSAGTTPAAAGEEEKKVNFTKRLYETPYLFEAREFLRKKLIGKHATITIDYKQPANDRYPEKLNCTVCVNGFYVTEALVSKGLASVIKYRSDNEKRSSRYEKLVEAEQKAIQGGLGIHSKKEAPVIRLQDLCGQIANSKKILPFMKRLGKTRGIVEYVAGASRMKIYITKEQSLVNFVLAGIVTPRGTTLQKVGDKVEINTVRDEGFNFTKNLCLHRDVEVAILDVDKLGVFIGWAFLDGKNISTTLLSKGFADLHPSANATEFSKELKDACEEAKENNLGIWRFKQETVAKPKPVSALAERQINYETVIMTMVYPNGHFYVQNVENRGKLIELAQKIMDEVTNNPVPIRSGWPEKGKIYAAKFPGDGNWYRARIENVLLNGVQVLYIDYGNRGEVNLQMLIELPDSLKVEPPYVSEHVLACIKFPTDEDDQKDSIKLFMNETFNNNILMNIEIPGSPSAVTLVDPETGRDLGKGLIQDGLALVDDPRDRRLKELVAEYYSVQNAAKTARLNIWRHGDVTDDDAAEFGAAAAARR